MAKEPIILTDQIIPPPALVRAGLETLPTIIRAQGERASRRFIEFFTATIRNRNTRMAYARAVKRFFDWCDDHHLGLSDDEIAKLKEKPGRDLLLSGSGRLFNELMRENLIDLYRFMVHPVVLGKGARLLDDGGTERVLELVGTQSFDTGILILEYRPSPQTTR